MNTELLRALSMCETDIDGALRRFVGNEKLYISCLNDFLEDPTMEELDAAIDTLSWDDAFTAAHALKGLAGNMGFVPLFHSTAELVVLIRAGRVKEIDESNRAVRKAYSDIIEAIRIGIEAEEREKEAQQ